MEVTVLSYINDLLCTCIDPSIIKSTLDSLQSKLGSTFTVDDKNFHSYIGICDTSVPVLDPSAPSKYSITSTVARSAADYLLIGNMTSVKLVSASCITASYQNSIDKLLHFAKRTHSSILLPVIHLENHITDIEASARLKRIYDYIDVTNDTVIRAKLDDEPPPLINPEDMGASIQIQPPT